MSTNSPLSEISGYNELVSYYEKNKDKPISEWLKFDCMFEKPGKQGLVGLFETLEGDNKMVFKISQYINYLVHHESIVMKSLCDLSAYCPHFCKGFGDIICDVEPKCNKQGNPFELKSKYSIKKEALLCEYIDRSCKFYNYIRSEKVSEEILYSTIKQVLMAISIAQKKKKFSHYDLHSDNIMMRKCNKDVVFLYVLDEDNQFCIPTFGRYPVIIDYGFSYIKDMDDGPLWPSMAHTDVGFMSDRFDWVADPKLFLVTVSGEIKEKRKSKKSKRLRRIVKNIFFPLKIDWESGWDNEEEKGASDYVLDMLEEYNDCSKLFEDYDHYCIDILQSLIILPIEEQCYSNIHITYKVFLKEWVKIENEISSPFYNLYILKGLVDAARLVRPDYIRERTRNQAVKHFRTSIYDLLSDVSQFCVPKNVHFERLLCALLNLSRNIEGVLYDVMTARMSEKEKMYRKMPLQSPEQIFAAVDANIKDDYEYNENTNIFILNSVNEDCNLFKLPAEEIENVNSLHSFARGTYIYDLFKQSNK